MKDFDTSNQFYYHDVIAGITELLLAYLKHRSKDENSFHESNAVEDVDITKVWEFCKEYGKYQPELKVIDSYLFEEGLSVLGLLEAQKYGDFDLDMLFTKLILPLQFTVRGISYGPALCYHIRDMNLIRPFEETAVRSLWVSNKSNEPGHCRPQDQNLEVLFNNSAKNCFKLGTVQNVLNRASMIQERELCHGNLKQEMDIDNCWTKPSKHQFKADSFIRLRACLHRGLKVVLDNLQLAKSNFNDKPVQLHALHFINIAINHDVVNVEEIGKDRVKKFVSVKIAQPDGWKLQNPKFKEILTVPRSIT